MSEAQRAALSILPKISGSVSIACSSLIIFSVLRDPKKRARIYERLLCGISLVAVSSSFWLGLSTWPIPNDSSTMFAVGSEATCTMQGFFIQVGNASAFYNVSLAIYYFLVIRKGWTEKRIRKLEPFMHTVPLLWGLSTALISIPLQLFNDANLWCWIASFPKGCEGDECLRGVNADFYRWLFFYVPLWASILFVSVCMMLVFVHVRNASNYIDQESNGDVDTLLDETPEDKARADEERNKRKQVKKEVAMQCFLYAGSFYFNWVGLTTVRILQATGNPVPIGLLLFAAFATPLQGLPYFGVYIFPKFRAARQAHPDATVGRWIVDSLYR